MDREICRIFVGMRLSLTQLQRTLSRMPMLRVLLPLACGIALANAYALPLLFWVGGALLLAFLMLLFRSSLYGFAALMLAGGALFELSSPQEELPYGQTSLMRLQVEEEPVARPYGASTKARLEAWRGAEGEWQGSSVRLNLSLDSTVRVEAGDRLLVRGRLRPYASDRGYWSRLQLIRGYGGRLYLREESLLEQSHGSPSSLLRWHEGAVERIERLPLKPESRAVVLAMACGERREVDSLLRQSYARSGASHLLAVSGLHVGVVFLLLTLLLGALPLLRYGHLVRGVLVVGAIWLYALMTGASPSVVRAATMFTLFQVGLLVSGRSEGMNTLCGALVLILLLQPESLFDVSLQLSALAVGAIVSWTPRRLREIRRPWLRWLVGSMVISLVATLATMPLISYRFGVISLVGILLSPWVVLTAQLLVALSTLWVVLPIGWLAPLFGWVIDLLARLQNGVLLWMAEWEFAAVECRIGEGTLALLYLLFALLTGLAWCVESKKELSLLSK